MSADEHPDHDTLNAFRKRFLKQIEALMVQVLLIARAMGVLKLGNIALDGSKIKANASAQRPELRAHQATGTTIERRSRQAHGAGGTGGQREDTGRHEPAQRNRPPRRKAQGHRNRPRQD